MNQASLDFNRPIVPALTDPERFLKELFSSQAARDGLVIRRKAKDIEKHAGWQRFMHELNRRGYRAFENSGQVIIFCNRAPIRPISPPPDA